MIIKGRSNLKLGMFYGVLNFYLNYILLNIISNFSKYNIFMFKKRILLLWGKSIVEQKDFLMQIIIVQENKMIEIKELNIGVVFM